MSELTATAGEPADASARRRLEVADIFRRHGADFLKRHALEPRQCKVVTALAACRTAALGGHLEVCHQCGTQRPSYNSCRDRHCPKCQRRRRNYWLETCRATLPDVPYFHVVFTLPHEIGDLAVPIPGGDAVRRLIYRQLFASAWAAVSSDSTSGSRLDARQTHVAQRGMIAVLHTWGQKLQHHPHVHCLIPAGELRRAGVREHPEFHWIPSRRFFVAQRELADRFRDHFVQHLRRKLLPSRKRKRREDLASRERERPDEALKSLDPLFLDAVLTQAQKRRWIVNVGPPVDKGREVILGYLARYSYRMAFHNKRLLEFTDGNVTFRYRDNRHGGRKSSLTLPHHEFIRRFLLHVLPPRFVRIRHFGLFQSHRKEQLARVRALLGEAKAASAEPTSAVAERTAVELPDAPPVCPACRQATLARVVDFFGKCPSWRAIYPFDSS
jgi:hypothetical protein